jgi:hypothetical protein
MRNANVSPRRSSSPVAALPSRFVNEIELVQGRHLTGFIEDSPQEECSRGAGKFVEDLL